MDIAEQKSSDFFFYIIGPLILSYIIPFFKIKTPNSRNCIFYSKTLETAWNNPRCARYWHTGGDIEFLCISYDEGKNRGKTKTFRTASVSGIASSIQIHTFIYSCLQTDYENVKRIEFQKKLIV